MMGYSKSHPDYIRVQIMVEAMENLLTYEQQCRIRKAVLWGGFDAAMLSLARVSEQIVKARRDEQMANARQEGRIVMLQEEVQSQKERADAWMNAFNDFPARLADARKAG